MIARNSGNLAPAIFGMWLSTSILPAFIAILAIPIVVHGVHNSAAEPILHLSHLSHSHQRHLTAKKSNSNTVLPSSLADKSQQPEPCAFGVLPGILDMNRTAGDRWQILPTNCQLKNYLQDYAAGNSTAVPPLAILFLSDSNDVQVILSYCSMVAGVVNKTNGHHKYNKCENGTSSLLTLEQVYLPTLTPREAVQLPRNYMGGRVRMDGYRAKMKMARSRWSELHPGSEPEVVVLGGGLWDIFRWLKAPPEGLEDIEKTVRQNKTISDDLMIWWMNSTRGAILHARSLFPHSKLVWRSYAMPSWNPKTGAASNHHLGTKQLLFELNSAGIAVAMDLDLQVVNVAAMVEGFAQPRSYLHDKHHARGEVMLEVLNVYLNIALNNRSLNSKRTKSAKRKLPTL